MFQATLFLLLAGSAHLALSQPAAPIVDLEYAQYQGYYSAAQGLNVYKGIRYAAAPIGKLRWQLPQTPETDRSHVFNATSYGSQCPQAFPAPNTTPVFADEDCLFLNVFAPPNATNLPVFFYIHGGGYGAGNTESNENVSNVTVTSDYGFIFVTIQYRLGAFGFLSSDEVLRRGTVNAGLHDMHFALNWTQQHIKKFGGDPTKVTIGGESAGGGSVMLMAMANGGEDGTTLFQQGIASSPYLPTQWGYDDFIPSQTYYNFAEAAGCLNESAAIFACLQNADTLALQNASAFVSGSGTFGTWAFLPVTDGTFIRQRPSVQLLEGSVNGIRMLTSNNANEGPLFTPRNITTEAKFVEYVRLLFPLFSEQNITSLLELYSVPENFSSPQYDAGGLVPPYQTTTSVFATGWQQAANNLYAETTFVCPSYWLADAYASTSNKKAWRYQFSLLPANHALDLTPLSIRPETAGVAFPTANEVFARSFQEIWGNFIISGDPTLTSEQAVGKDNITAAQSNSWVPWSVSSTGGYPTTGPIQLNLNMTGGVPSQTAFGFFDGTSAEVTTYVKGNDSSAPPFAAKYSVVDADSWEGGRGKRCALWVELGPWVME